MAESFITAEVDFNLEGKQAGFLRLPHSVHRSAYGWIPVPVVVIQNGKGPTLLLSAGNHGDEYEGQIALANLAKELKPEDINGRIIILTMVNFPAAQAGTRVSPLDGGNLNRSFPGNPRGTPTEKIAHYIEEVLLPLSDYYIDLHSGGSSLFYEPTLLRGLGQDTTQADKLTTLQDAFDLPYAWVFTSGGGRDSVAPTAMGAANRNGVTTVMAELGGAGVVTNDALHMVERGLRRIMQAIGMLPTYQPDAKQGTRTMKSLGMIYAYAAGVLEMQKDIGDQVSKGEVVARIHHPDTPLQPADPVPATLDGFVLCKRAMGQVERGDTIYQIGTDIEI